jgi:hypothetical protein
MAANGFETRIKVQQIIQNQLPEFILEESPKLSSFLKQYYISQEYQGGSVDLADNLDQYIKLDNLTPEVIVGFTTLTSNIGVDDSTIYVDSTKGFPQRYGLFKIDDEIITYTEITENSFTGCIRGFSAITNLHEDLNNEELVFETSKSSEHRSGSKITNLSVLFLQEFYKKIKYSLTPGLEDTDFTSNLNVGNFIKESKSLYASKGTEESFRILFNVLFGITPKVINLDQYLIKTSGSTYLRREVALAERISGNPLNLIGQTIKKRGDDKTSAAISEVEIVTRNGKNYYKLLIFVGYDDSTSFITGNFNITPSTRVLEEIEIGSTIVTVDSTIGFPESGSLIFNDSNTGLEIEIFYTTKSVNQFFGCYTGSSDTIEVSIPTTTTLRTSGVYYGYENGDLSKEVELRVTGVLSNLIVSEDFQYDFVPGDQIYVNYLGDLIKFSNSRTYKEIVANSFIYNTRSRYQIETFSVSGNTLTTKSEIDKVSLKVGDNIEILLRNSENIVSGYSDVEVVDIVNKTITINASVNLDPSQKYDIRRNLKKASSSIIPLQFSPNVLCDVQNTYSEGEEYLYMASNSLPEYQINSSIFKYNVQDFPISGYNEELGKSSIIQFSSEISFVTGDRVYYQCSQNPIDGLQNESSYFIEVLPSNTEIRLYTSRSFVGTEEYILLGDYTRGLPEGQHTFVLYEQREAIISPQKILRKIKISPDNGNTQKFEVVPGPLGTLVNGVELLSYKTNDKIYYGPIEKVQVLNGGENFDVINPPLLEVSYGDAKVQPVVSGSVEKVFVDPQDFDVDVAVSVSLIGGNGSGASFQPVIRVSSRELSFDGREFSIGGGVDIDSETITFYTNHSIIDGQVLIYNSNNNQPLGISSIFQGSNSIQNTSLVNNAAYYAKVVNDKTIRLHTSYIDVFSGINTVGFTTANTTGVHKFRTDPKKSLSEIRVLDGGSGYQNKKLIVKNSGISTQNYSINFTNHGFSDGDLIEYNYQLSPISGLSTSNRYYILKVDDNSFRLCDAGIGGTITSNYDRENYVKITSTGSGYQYFSYPPITMVVTYASLGIGTTAYRGEINATPVVKGSITDVYVYENGSDYGSTILNVNRTPSIVVKNGSFGQLRPLIINGQIISVQVQYGGNNYYSVPDLIVSGDGIGATLRAIIQDGRIVDVVVINSGFGYSQENTTIIVKSAGSNSKFDLKVRSLTVNSSYKYGNQEPLYRSPSSEILLSSNSNLQYYVGGYYQDLIDYFSDNGSEHSPIIGWAYDGNPIYGPYGYENPNDSNSTPKLLQSGYSQIQVENRPNGFSSGFFVEDFAYTGAGDLDEYNGRFCKTPEFPNGTYAYFATVEQNPSGNYVGKFPYFVGEYYRSRFIPTEVLLNQSFDFNQSGILRNTHPYKVGDKFADNDFIIESNELVNQKTVVESVFSGSIESFDIVSPGNNYNVGDELSFAVSGSKNDLVVGVTEIKGKEISSIQSSTSTYNNSILTWENGSTIKITIKPNHDLIDGDRISVSGVSTSLSTLSGIYRVGVETYTATLSQDLGNYGITGEVTDIFVSGVPSNVSIGSSIKIENEIFTILNVYNGLLRVKRYIFSPGSSSHFASTPIYFLPDSVSISKKTDRFNSQVDKKIFFNPTSSVGIGTSVGITINKNFTIGDIQYSVPIPTQSLYLPNHPFKTNEQVLISKPIGSADIFYSNDSTGSFVFGLFGSSNSVNVYIINKSKDFVGISTSINLTSSGGIFFISDGDDNDQYSIETTYYQEKASVVKNKATISLASNHSLIEGDSVSLSVKPNSFVGIGTSNSVKIKYNQVSDLLLVNPIEFGSANVNTNNNTITLLSHGFESGDKVYYSSGGSSASGLFDGFVYFVRKIDNDTLNLCESYPDSISSTAEVINISTTGGNSQELSLINPEIKVVKNNNLVFNLSDPSLSGYKFNIYYDESFGKQFVSVGSTNNFIVTGVGTAGISTDASLSIRYQNTLPERLFYNVEKGGYISTSDKDVINGSQITFIDSEYFGTYNIYGISSTTFDISLIDYPENVLYTQDNCDILEYSTKSLNASGGVSKIKIISSSEYKEIPKFTGNKKTVNGIGAYLVAKSNEIGKIKNVRIISGGFDYASDKTLRPSALFPQVASIKSSNTIERVNVEFGGNNYITPPDIVIIDSETRKLINAGDLRSKLRGSTIESVDVVTSPSGLPSIPVDIKAVNNSNGISINLIQSSSSGLVTCILSTPISGFSTDPFSIGDLIWVENIEKSGADGTGFNSSDYGYRFFTVTNYYSNSNPGRIEYSIAGLTTNPGIAKTVQDGYATIVKSDNYPVFESVQKHVDFFVGEKVSTDKGFGYENRDLVVAASNENFVRLIGNYELSKEEKIRGDESFNVATINEVKNTKGSFSVESTKKENIGWSDETGKLSEDSQVLADNDYYQNLSYTVKSSKEWNDIVTPVNRLVHSSGLKNFSDTEILNSVAFSIDIDQELKNSETTIINDFIDERRVDTINNFELVTDTDINVAANTLSSKFIRFDNLKLSDYFEVRSNRVLTIDDISQEFSSLEDANSDFSNVYNMNESFRFNRFLIQTIGTNESNERKVEISEVVTLNDDLNVFTLNKGNLSTEDISMGDYYGDIDELEKILYLKFDVNDRFNLNHSIKIINTEYKNNFPTGVDEFSVGFVKLFSTKNIVSVGSTTNILSLPSSDFKSFYANIAITCSSLSDMNYVELYVNHDDSNTYYSELYFDSKDSESSQKFIGTFTSYLSGGVFYLDFHNSFEDTVQVVGKIIGFGSTSSGPGTYRFKLAGQSDGSERTVIYESNYTSVSGVNTSTVLSINKDLFSSIKSTVKVSVGNSSALHQVLLVHDGDNIFTTQYPFLSTNDTLGIGTFGAEYSGSNIILKFYSDLDPSSDIEISSFNEEFYQVLDEINVSPVLEYGSVSDKVLVTNIFGINLDDINKKDFSLFYENTPIFMKTVDPSDTNVLDRSNGIFYVPNHFFSTGEELIYRAESTFIGVAGSAMGIGATSDHLGITTDRLPSKVYAIKINNDQFRISTRKDFVDIGIGVTFTDIGTGNAHQFEMFKKNEKSLITINNLVQYPLAYTDLGFTLSENIGIANTVFSLSGISSVNPKDLLRIDDEYMLITNVGFGTSSIGPITFNGDFPLVEVDRGVVGSAVTDHASLSSARIYRGSYNIVRNKIYFTDPPRGGGFYITDKDDSNLTRERAKFAGRVFLKKDYTSNQVYDNISEKFTGIGATYTLTTQGINTVGLGTSGGNGVLFINNVFQAPTTENNSNNNFAIIEVVSVSGITSVIFSGITDDNGDLVISEYDVNENQLPRGGMIVSLGSTIGVGYAPLVGAYTTSILNGSGTIIGFGTDINYGSGYRSPVSIAVTDLNHTGTEASITAVVGAGGTLSFNIVDGGSGYVSPIILIPPPNYENLEVEGTFRVGIGSTTETGIGLLMNVEVGVSDRDPIPLSGKNSDGARLIRENKLLIAEDSVGRMLDAYPGFSVPGGNQNCIDDIVIVLESIAYNLEYGGNNKVYESGKIYIDNGYLVGEEEESVFAYLQARDLAIKAIRNQPIGITTSATIGITTTVITGIDTSVTNIGKQIRYLPNIIDYNTSITDVGIGSIIINKPSLNLVSITTSITLSEYSVLPQFFDYSIEGDISGTSGIYEPADCADVASAIGSFVGIVTNAITFGTLPTNKVGVAASVFEITGFKIKRPGYGFRRGDRITPVGLVTAKELSSPIIPFELTVVDIFNDSFGAWQFGELNYIDSIRNYQDGQRTRFPLFFNGQLISFETNQQDQDSQLIDFDPLLIIFINGILQEPKISYQFSGGTSFTFTTPPKSDDVVSVFFYVGTSGEDSFRVDVIETIKPGDDIQILSSNAQLQNTKSQDTRTIIDIVASDRIETNLYSGDGIDPNRLRPASWTKQKKDLFINNTVIYKSRDSIETQIYPTSKIIKDFSSTSTELFVDNSNFFNYEGENPTSFGMIIIDEYTDPVSAAITAIVSAAGTIQSLVISDPGNGYDDLSTTIKISAPQRIGVGIGTTATANVSVSNGQIVSTQIINPGFGYTFTSPPQIILSLPSPSIEIVSDSLLVNGFDGVITSISTCPGIGVPLALQFTLERNPLSFPSLQVGYPLYITDTNVGNGLVTVDTDDTSVVGIGTTCLDNIYYIHAFDSTTGIVTCNIRSDSNIVGIVTTGSFNYPVGRFSWGRIFGFERSLNPISISVSGKTVTSGLSTYPTVQRRQFGLRSTGALKKQVNGI